MKSKESFQRANGGKFENGNFNSRKFFETGEKVQRDEKLGKVKAIADS